MTDRPGPLTKERRKTHGDWADTARIASRIKLLLETEYVMRERRSQRPLLPHQREAVDMIVCKIARIVSGDPDHPDHFDDIAGYALLGKGGGMTAGGKGGSA